MANVLVVIELCEGKALPVCLEALGQARRLGTHLGATVYAVVPLKHAPRYGEDDVIAILARHGADKVVLVTDEAVGADGMRWGTHGAAISMVSDMLPPSLLVFGATPGAREVAPRAAARMGAAFLAEAWLEVREDRLALWEGAGAGASALDGDLEFPVVATVPAGRYALATGDDEAEVEVVNAATRPPDFDELGWEADLLGRPLVLGGESAAEAGAELARALGGTQEATPEAAPRLLVTLGPPVDGVRAQVKVALGDGAIAQAGAHYALSGPPAESARALALALLTPAPEPPKPDDPAPAAAPVPAQSEGSK